MKKSGLKNKIFLLILVFRGLTMAALSAQEPFTRKITLEQDSFTCDLGILYRLRPGRPVLSEQLRYFWVRSGRLKSSEGNYSGDLLHGTYEKFRSNGDLSEKGSFNSGLKDGEWFKWDDEGKIHSSESWKNGVLKKRISFSSDSVTEERFRNNVLYRKKAITLDGRTISAIHYRNGKPVPDKSWFAGITDAIFGKKKLEPLPEEPATDKN